MPQNEVSDSTENIKAEKKAKADLQELPKQVSAGVESSLYGSSNVSDEVSDAAEDINTEEKAKVDLQALP